MIPMLLAQKIVSLFIMMLLGAIAVKTKRLKSEDSKLISVLVVYLITPCMLITAFQIDYNDSIRAGLLLAVGAAVVLNLLQVLLTEIWHRIWPLDAIEKFTLTYSNCGNLIIPIIVFIMGEEWVIYSSAFIAVLQILMWSHGVQLLTGEKHINFKKIFGNINMIAILLGIVLMLLQIRFPAPLQDALSSVGGMIGPIAMIITGMVIAGMDLRKALLRARLWIVVAGRLLLLPGIGLLVLKYSGFAARVPNGGSILLITLLAASAPAASSVTQLAQLYNKDVEYAGALNAVTTLLCIVTMPLMVMIYQM